MTAPHDRPLAAYTAVTAAYWAFMLTDGALRMLVLLHFHLLGFSPLTLAYLFLLYEVMGMVTNLSAGWLAQRFGLAATLYAGLALQIAALMLLTAVDATWSLVWSVAYVTLVQGLSGVAKDLAKMSAKSAVKLLAPRTEGGLFRWVALLTGSKNAVKGLGFFIGTVLLAVFGFQTALVAMATTLALVLALVLWLMPKGLPTGVKGIKFTSILSVDLNVNRLSLARLFLFGSRDVWFVVGVPIFFYGVLGDGSSDGKARAFQLIGGFMAGWIILYGLVQAQAPRLLRAGHGALGEVVAAARRWVGILALVPLSLACLAWALLPDHAPVLGWTMVAGLLLFGAIFALNSAIHSYLILAFAKADRVAMDVGFYYMSNAAGRLLGTLLSGLSYQFGGLALCLATAALMAMLSWLAARRIQI